MAVEWSLEEHLHSQYFSDEHLSLRVMSWQMIKTKKQEGLTFKDIQEKWHSEIQA